ncbi:ESX secretion-associated protein EspG [Actinokineospora bangkokensis]|uniref:ESX secretion-associated protein EspG n=1 Tax=Actinokineospora bangkokensis TaxID=1193682 RepID=A0A1Q9LDQ3_9PSEU|nr:ESX secretion-associated protein EspG [Actinokineospora bangkokensis]OLR90135.1 hypothetical protein BJP25_03945 [Actinokineospora bangkokensis]
MVTELNLGFDQGADVDEAGAWLDPVEVDLLCAFAEVSPPFPLKVVPRGETTELRRQVFAGARARLAERGLADRRGPRGVAADLVRLLGADVGAVDLLVARRGRALGVVVLALGAEALLVTQDVRGDGGRVHVLAVPAHEVIEHVLALVPDHPPAMVSPFSLSRRALDAAHRAVLARAAAGDPLSPHEVDRLMAEHGVDEQSARRLTANLQPVLGNGQAGTAYRSARGRGWERAGEELRWLDTARGRFRLGGDPGSDWMSVNPLSGEELVVGLRTLAGGLWYR